MDVAWSWFGSKERCVAGLRIHSPGEHEGVVDQPLMLVVITSWRRAISLQGGTPHAFIMTSVTEVIDDDLDDSGDDEADPIW